MGSSKSKKKKKKLQRNWNGTIDDLKKKGFKVIPHLPGKTKMSVVFKEFVKPYMELAHDEEGYNKLFTVAMVAWNASLLSDDQRIELIESCSTSLEPSLKDEFKNIIQMMIERKKLYFSKYKRQILDYQITDQGDDIHLSVLSTFT